jgi:hypothetical protein
MLQAERSQVRFPMSLDFSIVYSFQPHYILGVDSVSNRYKYRESSWGGVVKGGRLAHKADSLTAICEPTA